MGSRLLKKGRNPSVVDNWLDSLGLYRKNVAFDETCLFRAASEQMFDCQVHHERVRKQCIDYARDNWSQFVMHFDSVEGYFDHLELLEKHMIICGNVEIEIISYTYNYDVIVYNAANHTITNVTQRNLPDKLNLCLIEDHYDVIYPKEKIETAGFCQSIVYKLLYEEVFKIPNVDDIVDGMLYSKNKIVTQAQVMAERKLFGELNDDPSLEDLSFDLDGLDSFSESVVAPFPFKVAKALDPTIYRNIEYDSWGEVRREMRLGDWYNGDEKLTLGTKCMYHKDEETLECYIQDIFKESNECEIYLTQLAQRRRVKYGDLSPENDAKPWPLPYRFSKNLIVTNSNINGNEKISKSPKKPFGNDKRRTKSCSDGAMSRQTSTDIKEKIDNIHLFIGDPLQMRPPSEENKMETKSTTPQILEDFPTITDPIGTTESIFMEQPPWHFMPPTPDPYIWPSIPPNSSNMFNYNVRPMIASAPVTPDVIPYHNQNFPFFYNCQVESNATNFFSWSNPVNNGCFVQTEQQQMEQTGNSPIKSNQSISDNQQLSNEVDYSQLTACPPPQNTTPVPTPTYERTNSYNSPIQQTSERPIVCTTLTPQTPTEIYSPQFAPYSPMIPLAPTPLFSPQVPEMIVPQQPYTVYTPTMDIQYVSPNPFVYPPTPPTTWYPANINAQGFIFPTPSTVQNIPPN